MGGKRRDYSSLLAHHTVQGTRVIFFLMSYCCRKLSETGSA